ncbi:hypothetical protein FF1_001774 [Malus domestica]
MYEAGKLVMVLNAEKVFDEIAKRQEEDAAGNLFDRMTPLFHNMVVCCQFCLTIGAFWIGWDPGGGLAKILGMMLCSKHQANHCDKYPQFLIPQLHFINHALHVTCLLQVMQNEEATATCESVFDMSRGRRSFIVAGKAEELLLPSRDDEKSCTNICVSKRSFDFSARRSEEEALEVMHVFSSALDGYVLRYLNFLDNAMGENGVNALLSSQNKLEELYLMNMATLNMCHNTREWHRDVIRKIKWLSEKGISIMIDTEGQANYEDFSDSRDIS